MLRLISIAILALTVAACDTAATPNAACTTCEIELERVSEISDAFDPGVFPELLVYADRDTRGRIYATSKRRDASLSSTRTASSSNGPGN